MDGYWTVETSVLRHTAVTEITPKMSTLGASLWVENQPGPKHAHAMRTSIPSGNQTWQWKTQHLEIMFILKRSFIADFPASHA